MHESKHYFGQAVFGQLISLIDTNLISNDTKEYNSDYYTKKFNTLDHLISMFFSSFAHYYSSLREVAGARFER